MSTPADPIRLSVIFVARHNLACIHKILECLLAQTAAARIELIISTDSPELLRDAEEFLAPRARFWRTRFLLQRTEDLAKAHAQSVVESTGDAVVIIEDHSFPDPNFAEELLAAFETSPFVQAAAPVLINPNPATAVSRAQFLNFHGRRGGERPDRPRFEEVPALPWHNTAYRRSALAGFFHDEDFLQIESFVQQDIVANTPTACFVCCTRTTSRHVNMSSLGPALQHAFLGGRVFAGKRAERLKWGVAQKAARSALFPAVAMLKMKRNASIFWDVTSPMKNLSTSSAALLLAFSHALGEAVGTLLGVRRSTRVYSGFEYNRARFLRPADRHFLSVDATQPATNFTDDAEPARPSHRSA
jgi:hypothetical protein